MLGKLINTYHTYTECMSSALNRSSTLERFECCNASEIHNGIMFDFYHMYFSYTTVLFKLIITKTETPFSNLQTKLVN